MLKKASYESFQMEINIVNGSVEYDGEPVLSQINFQIHEKEKIALVGRNGCGKTTLLRVLAGREPVIQRLAGENCYRPGNEEILAEFSDTFDLDIEMCTIDDFGGWDQAYADFFEDGAIFDEIYY